jgi:hypothetical protein
LLISIQQHVHNRTIKAAHSKVKSGGLCRPELKLKTDTKKMNNTERVYKMIFAGVYPMYVQKAEKKGRTKVEVDTVIFWLTGYDAKSLQDQIDRRTTFEIFFAEAPSLHPNAHKITGMICGYRIEEIEDPLMKKVRYLDKLVDELAKGRVMEKVLRR